MDPLTIASLVSAGSGLADTIFNLFGEDEEDERYAESQSVYNELIDLLNKARQEELGYSQAPRTDAFGTSVRYDPVTKSWSSNPDPTVQSAIDLGKSNALNSERAARTASEQRSQMLSEYLSGRGKYNEAGIMQEYMDLFDLNRKKDRSNIVDALGRQAVRMNQSNFLPQIAENFSDSQDDVRRALLESRIGGRKDYQSAQGFEDNRNLKGYNTFDQSARANSGAGLELGQLINNQVGDARSGLTNAIRNTGQLANAYSGKAGGAYKPASDKALPIGAIGKDLASLIQSFGKTNESTHEKNQSRLTPSGGVA